MSGLRTTGSYSPDAEGAARRQLRNGALAFW